MPKLSMPSKIHFFLSTFSVLYLAFCSSVFATTLSYDDARHLLIRTEFSAPHERIIKFSGLTKTQAARKIIRTANTTAHKPLPDWYMDIRQTIRDIAVQRLRGKQANAQERKIRRQQFKQYGQELRQWWYEEMILTPSPFTEKMTLFWHNHFATNLQKVKRPDYMLTQNITLRKYALGSFNDLLHAIAKDPAMILFLDNQTNRKGAPNENFAREVMELFTMGEGNYTETDIKEAARAFTGWSVNKRKSTFIIRKQHRDNGIKKVLGQRGNFDGEDILNILLDHPQTAELITAKLWKEFISPTPDPKEVRRMAKLFRHDNYDISTLMQAILTSDHFYAQENRTSLIKSPVDLLVGTFRQFQIHPPKMLLIIQLGRSLGQDIFNPPNVKGWPGGTHWINSHTLTTRQQFLERVFRAQEMPPESKNYVKRKKKKKRNKRMQKKQINVDFNLDQWLKRYPSQMSAQRIALTKILISDKYLEEFQADIQDTTISQLEFIKTLVTSPYYELK